jgi:CBS domain-containing protein
MEETMLITHILGDKGKGVYAVSAEATLEEAARELYDKRVGAVVVLDGDGALAGLLSERDIVREVAQRGVAALGDKVATAMTRALHTADPGETVDDGLARMTDRRVRHLPVIERGRLIGIVSIGDLVKHKIEETQAEAEAMKAYIAAG